MCINWDKPPLAAYKAAWEQDKLHNMSWWMQSESVHKVKVRPEVSF